MDSRPAVNACLECRKIKVRCRIAQDASSCERCIRKTFHCVFQKHQRGRKPGTRVAKTRLLRHPSGSDPAGPFVQHSSEAPESHAGHGKQTGQQVAGDAPLSTLPVASEVEDSSVLPPDDPNGLQPSALLNHAAMRGKFSLRQILSPDDGNVAQQTRESSPVTKHNDNDPIGLGFVNEAIARSLFDSFLAELNPYICQLDTKLHTFDYVRRKSPFLLSSVLAVTAKVFNPLLYKGLYSHAQHLFTRAFETAAQSAETVQAILILTYWKEPQDTRAWTTLGYVIRVCMDMGWHRLRPKSPEARQQMSDEKARELRNIERTWYVVFVYDRSISMQTGRPWMIERNLFIDSIETWYDDPVATENDVLLASFVTLRLETCDLFKSLQSQGIRDSREAIRSIGSMLSLARGRVERWEQRWVQALPKSKDGVTSSQTCHHFLLAFYSTHVLLQLFSFPLQAIIASGEAESSPGLDILWSAYSGALEMLLLIKRFASRVYFAQDSIHIMTAYSAAFLVKLVHSAPPAIVEQVQGPIVEAIHVAAEVLNQQQAPKGSSCALQAKFLSQLSSDLERRRNMPTTSDMASPAVAKPYGYVNREQQAQLAQSSEQMYGHAMTEMKPFEETAECFVTAQVNRTLQPDYQWMDDNIWEDWFATAGFSTQDGMFLA